MSGPFDAPEPTARPPAGEPRRARPRPKRGWLASLLLYGGALGAAFLIGVLLFNLVIMPAFVHNGDEVRVPDLSGKSLAAAENLLRPKGLVLGEATQRNDARPAGTIAAQHPAPNASVKRGRVVAIVVSLGEAGITVPSLLGETLQNARMALDQDGLVTGDVVSAPCDTVAYNTVIATRPAAGRQAGRGERVDLLLSAGLERPALLMPDLAGRNAAEVLRVLADAGFAVTLKGDGGDYKSITRTEPPAGSRVKVGDAIELYTD